MDTVARPVAQAAPPAPTAWQWLRRNLFSSAGNTLLTAVTLVFLFVAVRELLDWVLHRANWTPVTSSFKLFAVGQYPTEQLWRVGGVVLLVSLLAGISWGRWSGAVGTFALALAVGMGLLALVPVGLDRVGVPLRLFFLANPVLVVAGRALGRNVVRRGSWLVVLWSASMFASLALLAGVPGVAVLPRVESSLWGGLLLTFMLALVGIIASFPIGVLLALGRRSALPLVRLMCTLFIEIVRGVPLVTILFMASILLPLFLPDTIRIDRVLRAMLGMTLFAAAYMAENVRGGLAAIPNGQFEAARAMGLNGVQTMLLIILPQALRTVIPAIVGQFIALFMDTTLAVIVGLLELLAVGKAIVQGNPAWLSLQAEVYVFIAVVFWVFTFSMSYASRRLETALGVGKR